MKILVWIGIIVVLILGLFLWPVRSSMTIPKDDDIQYIFTDSPRYYLVKYDQLGLHPNGLRSAGCSYEQAKEWLDKHKVADPLMSDYFNVPFYFVNVNGDYFHIYLYKDHWER